MHSWRNSSQALSLAEMGIRARPHSRAVDGSVSCWLIPFPFSSPQSPGAMSSRWPGRPRRAGGGPCRPPSPGVWRCPPGTAPLATPSPPPAPFPPAAPFTAWTGKQPAGAVPRVPSVCVQEGCQPAAGTAVGLNPPLPISPQCLPAQLPLRGQPPRHGDASPRRG